MRLILVLLMCASISIAQETPQVYEIPFGAKENSIELSVANTSTVDADSIQVSVTSAPDWLKFAEKTSKLSALKSNEEGMVSFSFEVEKTAKVNSRQTISFTITDQNGQRWQKDIAIKVLAPATYELYQNYPNPFNPLTTIEYQLPATSSVSLRVYDMLGREVAQLVNEQQQEAGGHQVSFDAHRYASGAYIYRLVASDQQNTKHTFHKKMVLVK